MESSRLAERQALLLAQLLENAIRSTRDLEEAEELQAMFG